MKILNHGYERGTENVADAESQEQSLLLPDYAGYLILLYGEVRDCFRGVRVLRETHVRRFGNGLWLLPATDHQ